MKLASTRNLLTPGEQAVLDLIRDNPDQLTRRDIVERLERTTSSIAVIITKLRRRGFTITSPRFREPGGKSLGVPQTDRLAPTEPSSMPNRPDSRADKAQKPMGRTSG